MFQSFKRLARSKRVAPRFRPNLETLEERRVMSANYLQTNLVSSVQGLAANFDPKLINPWGLTTSPTSPFWVSDDGSGFSTLYNTQGQKNTFVGNVVVPPNPSGPPGALGTPSGIVANSTSGFDVVPNKPAAFLFATEDGTISGWSFSVNKNLAFVKVNNPAADYTGLTLATDHNGRTLLYAANNNNGANGTIDVFDQNFTPVTNLPGSFQDPKAAAAGASPFNIQNIGGKLYVEYTEGGGYNDPGGAGHGFVDVFNGAGQLVQRLIHNGALNDPWGVALAPKSFGEFGGDLLVANFGDGRINAFNPDNGRFLGTLITSSGKPFQEDDLWALRFGNGAAGGNANTLYFTAGINDQHDGLLGSLQAAPKLTPHDSLLQHLSSPAPQTVSTVAANGDQNPYGVAFVPAHFHSSGPLQPGDLLVSDFNDATVPGTPPTGNVQGTGSSIVRITPDGQQSTFFQGTGQLGLTTALGVLQRGFVLVGSVPNTTGGVQQGSLLILDGNGNVVNTLADASLLNGPWDLTINDQGDQAQVFVANVLSGTVSRIDLGIPRGGVPTVESITQIASGYTFRTDPNALVVGPTGLAFDPRQGRLYVAATGDNGIFVIPNAVRTLEDHGTGQVVVQNDPHLHGPLGLVLAPNGDLIAANGDAVNQDPNNLNELVEFTPRGRFVAQFQLDNSVDSSNNIIPGAAFGIAVSAVNGITRFAAVDDNTNTVNVWAFDQKSDSSDQAGAHDEVFRQLAEAGPHHH